MNTDATPTRTRLLNAALGIVREQGYEATTVDELCAAAGVSKGAFFHHFASKEALAVAAAEHWNAVTSALFANAPYHLLDDPLDQLVAYIDFRAALLDGRSIPEATCYLGTMVQETYGSHPVIREACFAGIAGHARTIEEIIRAAKARHAPQASWSAEGLALHTQAVLQGAFVLAKAKNDLNLARESILHLRRYIELLFHYAKED
ncbi:MAG: TetR/AcrR family transcriptional regulator [Proteobacteria bacterium]|nr:TetR/AcrR family transcriptional regulator [Pseudomonadota bacterium]